MKTYPIAVSALGLHMIILDTLTPVEAFQLIKDIEKALFDWHNLTGKKIDGGKPR